MRHSLVTVPVVLAATGVTFALGWWQKNPCRVAGWPYDWPLMFGRRCYTDLPVLYESRGLAAGAFPYAPEAGDGLEYPVLTGLVADLLARMTRWLAGAPDPRTFVGLNALVLLACALAVVWATVATRGRLRDGLLVALAPSLALTAVINWDLLAVAATSLALLAWVRRHPVLAGALIGLGTAAKLYPALLLGPIVLLAVRHRHPGPAARAVLAAVLAWLAVNLPVALLYPDGWARFWRFNLDRGAEFGSVWYALQLLDRPVRALDPVALGAFGVLLAGVVLVALRAPQPPTLAVLGFLTVAAFLVTNKVYSPQYVLWLLPLAVLAGVSVLEWAVWQAAEVLYWLAVWDYLAAGETWQYPAATFLRVAVTLALMAAVGWRQFRCSLRQVAPSDEYAIQPSTTMS